jgi:hypothetical protein
MVQTVKRWSCFLKTILKLIKLMLELFKNAGSRGGTVVEQFPHLPKVKGLSLETATL